MITTDDILKAHEGIGDFVKTYIDMTHAVLTGFYSPVEAAVIDTTAEFTIYVKYLLDSDEVRIIGAANGVQEIPPFKRIE